MKKVLITGASGFVGFHLIKEALASNFDVYAAVRADSNVNHLQDFPIHFVSLDFTSVEKLKLHLEEEQYQFIIHAAGITKAKTISEYNNVNAALTKNLALAAASVDYPLEKFIFVSSLAALGPLNDLSGKIEDDSVARPVTNYGRSKLLAEQYLSEITQLPLVVIRPTAVYGPREKDIFILVNTIRKGLEPYIGQISQQLSFIYVSDLAHVIIKTLTSEIVNKSYNVSDGAIYTRYDFADFTKMLLHKKTIKIHIPLFLIKSFASVIDYLYAGQKTTPVINKEKIAELIAVNWTCNIHNIQKDLGFVPKFNLKDGLKETLIWYKNNNWL
jgi:nucleoside-diphosphate-sugar epimerase